MGAIAAGHPTDPILQAYGLGKLDDVSSASVSRHLEGCAKCQRRVAELTSDDFLARLQNAGLKPDKSPSGRSPAAGSSTDGNSSALVRTRPAETLPPELVDHPDYEIVRELGRGGMGVVYLANNRLMGRQEVLKVVGRHLIERPGVGDRFLREIRSAARLHHANIVAAYSALRLGDSLVLAMEYVEGLDLAKIVKTRGPMAIAQASYFIHQAALGLQHAHECGMVHRDMKPANLIVAGEGKKRVVKVMDFGLAKVTSEGETDSGLTREGQMLGTPDFIAPEQIRDAQSADIRADIYSLGCTFYYLLTGGPPFRGEHLWDLYQAHFSMEAGPLNLVRPEVPVELAAVVAKMMAKEPVRRFQTPGEVARALMPFFKPAAQQPVATHSEMSKIEPPVAPASTSTVGLAPTPLTVRTLTRRTASAGVNEGVAWESLIEFKETEQSNISLRSKPKQEPLLALVPRPTWASRKMIASASLVGFLTLSAIIAFLTTNKDRNQIKFESSVAGRSPERRNEHSSRTEKAGVSARTESAEATFRDGAREFSGKYYKVFKEFLRWHDARIECERMGGHLAIVRNREENLFLTSMVRGANLTMAWLGATDELNEGRWVWVDGSKMTYTAWDSDSAQPNNAGGNEHYLFLYAAKSGLWWDLWNEGAGGFNPGFVCQWDRPAAKTSGGR
jgi:serine/threonine protein kinase